MLKEISVKNYRKFKDKFTFNLNNKAYAFNEDAISSDLVKCGLVYGQNGCGKSNLMRAIADVNIHLSDTTSHNDNGYIYAANKSEPAEFNFEFVFNGTVVKYNYSKTSSKVCVKEELFIDDKQVIYFDRKAPRDTVVKLKGVEQLNFAGLEDKSDLSIIKYVFNNSVLEENEENSVLYDFMFFVSNIRLIRTEESHETFSQLEQRASEVILGDKSELEKKELKKFEDFLIEGGVKCKLAIRKTDSGNLIAFDFDGNLVTFSEIASTGTLVLANLYVHLKLNQSDALILLDEFDAFYHHNLSWSIIEKLKQLPNQVLLTTHNTVNMDSDLLRPDCMFNMTESEIKPLYACTNKELRKAHNYQKMYVAGAFDE